MTRDGGFTLMEILVVMALISLLMGFGIGMYTSMTSLGQMVQAENTIREKIRVVSQSSRSFPAALVVDPVGRRVYGLEFRTVAGCNFEPTTDEETSEVIGRAGKNGSTIRDAKLEGYPTGHTGGGLVVEGGGVDFGNYSDYDLVDGVSIDIWYFPTENRRMNLVGKGRSYGIRLREGAGGPVVVGYLSLGSVEEVRGGASKREERFEVEDYPLQMNRWNRILMNYEGTRVRISIDSWGRGPVPRGTWAEKDGRYIIPDRDASLVVGSSGSYDLYGRVDDLRVAGIFAGEPETLPEDVEVSYLAPGEDLENVKAKTEPLRIRFLDGRLDPDYHSREVSILLTHRGEERPKVITIGILGNIIK